MIDDIFCRIMGHRRSRSRAERVDGIWRSRCKRCGTRLVRVRRSKWREFARVDLVALRPELLGHLEQRYVAAEASGAEFRAAFFERATDLLAKRQDVAEGVVCRSFWE